MQGEKERSKQRMKMVKGNAGRKGEKEGGKMKLKGLTGRNNERKDGRAERKERKSTMCKQLRTILVTCLSKKKEVIEKKEGRKK